MSLESLIENLTVREDGKLLSRICLDFTLYTMGNVFEEKVSRGLCAVYAEVIERFGSNWTFYETESSEGPKRINETALQFLSKSLSPGARRRDQYALLLRDGEKEDDIGTTAFEFGAIGQGDFPGFLRISLPVSFLTDPGAAAYAVLCDGWAETIPFASGHAGFSLRWNEYGKRHYRRGLKHVEFIAEWYPGIDLPDDSLTILESRLQEQIRPISWLTYLHRELAAKVGDRERLRAALPPPVAIRELRNGWAIQAGPTPQPGNTPHAEDLAPYRAVAGVLKPIVMTEHPAIVRDMSSWLRRFYLSGELSHTRF